MASVDTVFDEDFLQAPHGVLKRLRAEAPVLRTTTPDGQGVWLVNRYDDARAALEDPRLAKDARNNPRQPAPRRELASALQHHMLNSDPPDHTRLRRLISKGFTPRRVELLRPRVAEISASLLGGLSGRTEFDLLERYAYPLPITVISELLGVPAGDQDDVRAWQNTLISMNTEDAEKVKRAATAMAEYLSRLIAAKRAKPGDDLLSALVEARDEGDRLTEDELVATAFLLMGAGYETTANLIGNGMLALLTHPDQLAALRADPALLSRAIEEFLRFESPATTTTLRFTTEPVSLGGIEIPAGDLVLVSVASANRDGQRFTDPDRFDVGRQADGHLGFGRGIHYCLGAPLARLEGEVAFRDLLRWFPRMELAEPVGRLRWRASTLIRGLRALPVRATGIAR
jgi:cytochrome P450